MLGNERDQAQMWARTGLRHWIIGIGDNATRKYIAPLLRLAIPQAEFVNPV